jgi:hypothetical protein
MKRALIIVSAVLFLISCQDKTVEQYKILSPIYMSYSDMRNAVKTNYVPEDLKNPGKIYYWNNFLFINEQGKGVHVIDDQDPSKPGFKAFINIPGNVDIAIKDGMLYADSYIDLVVIDINDISNIHEVNRVDSIFNYTIPPYTDTLKLMWDVIDPKKGIVTGYTVKKIEKELVTQMPNPYPIYYYNGISKMADNISYTSAQSSSSSSPTSTSVGFAGSMARFAITGNTLYVINSSYMLIVFDISTANKPNKQNSIYTNWSAETIFPYKNNLFIGTQSGMIVFNISDPLQPTDQSTFWHSTGCDPVVVDGNYAFITIRSGTRCNNNAVTNRLDVVNITNVKSPYLEKSYALNNPYGLGIDKNTLFVCDGDAGLKIYDISDIYKISDNLLASYHDNKAIDVIPLGGVLLMIGDQGFSQYDYSDLKNIKLLSEIKVKN